MSIVRNIEAATAKGAATHVRRCGKMLRTVHPTMADRMCPPMTLRGCDRGVSGAANSSTAVAPSGGNNRCIPMCGSVYLFNPEMYMMLINAHRGM